MIISWLKRKFFMYGFVPRPKQKILGFFLGKPDYIVAEELAMNFIDGFLIGLGIDVVEGAIIEGCEETPEYFLLESRNK